MPDRVEIKEDLQKAIQIINRVLASQRLTLDEHQALQRSFSLIQEFVYRGARVKDEPEADKEVSS